MNSNLRSIKEELSFVRFKKFFILEFTRQLIKNSSSADMSKLETIVEKENTFKVEDKKEKIKEKIRIREEEMSSRFEQTNPETIRSIMRPSVGMFESQKTPEENLFKDFFKKDKHLPKPKATKMLPGPFISPVNTAPRRPAPRGEYLEDPFRKLGFWVHDSKLPEHIQYLKPTPVNKEIDLAKLNPLVNDLMVNAIECYGPDENIVVKGGMGVKKTTIILDKEEINDIIQRFSRETKIPVQEGVFKVVAGKLILLAIISETVGAKFVIKKMVPEQPNHGM